MSTAPLRSIPITSVLAQSSARLPTAATAPHLLPLTSPPINLETRLDDVTPTMTSGHIGVVLITYYRHYHVRVDDPDDAY